ncbi:MAG: hypothetical protein O3C21_11750 [Verrucomicrobia bacterium]|nr:hypothetical protein [Verrucomicrobiota bacterium]
MDRTPDQSESRRRFQRFLDLSSGFQKPPADDFHGHFEPSVISVAGVDFDYFSGGGAGVDPVVVAEVTDGVDAVRGDGEIARQNGGMIGADDAVRFKQLQSIVPIPSAQSVGTGVVPPVVNRYDRKVSIQVGDRLFERGAAQCISGQATAVDTASVLTAPGVGDH